MNLRCFIIDDEPLAVKLLESYIQKTPFLDLKGSFTDALTAMTALSQENIDLLFLDIQMPELSGIELSKMIAGETRIVFTTAFSQYAIDSYKVNALDYLLKPISYADFMGAANKALRWFEMLHKATAVDIKSSEPTSTNTSTEDNKSIFIKTERKLVQIKMDSILYMEGLKDYIKIYTEESTRPILTLMTMKAMQDLLPSTKFVRVHRSYIVQWSKVEVIENNRILIHGKYIPVTHLPAL